MVEAKRGLPTLENGFDSIQLRIWYAYVIQDSSQLVIMKKSRGEWLGEFYSLLYRYNEKGDSLTSIDKVVALKATKSGWESTISRLLALDILNLPDYHEIPNYNQGADGDAVIVEIATRKLYRIYSYQEPYMHKTRVPEAGKMEAILELIEGEFGFFRLRK